MHEHLCGHLHDLLCRGPPFVHNSLSGGVSYIHTSSQVRQKLFDSDLDHQEKKLDLESGSDLKNPNYWLFFYFVIALSFRDC